MILFDAASHTYTNSLTNEKYTSVTTVLGKFKKPFERDMLSRRVADQRRISQQEVLDEWEKTSKEATDFGTKLHGVLETYSKLGTYEDCNKKIVDGFRAFGDFSTRSGALIEELVYNHEYKVAGTADIIYPDGPYFDVHDIKTNKAIRFLSKYKHYLLSPVDHLSECEYNSYSLQVSMYAYFYQQLSGRIPRRLSILHFDKITETFTQYPCIYLKRDVQNILNALPK